MTGCNIARCRGRHYEWDSFIKIQQDACGLQQQKADWSQQSLSVHDTLALSWSFWQHTNLLTPLGAVTGAKVCCTWLEMALAPSPLTAGSESAGGCEAPSDTASTYASGKKPSFPLHWPFFQPSSAPLWSGPIYNIKTTCMLNLATHSFFWNQPWAATNGSEHTSDWTVMPFIWHDRWTSNVVNMQAFTWRV